MEKESNETVMLNMRIIGTQQPQYCSHALVYFIFSFKVILILHCFAYIGLNFSVYFILLYHYQYPHDLFLYIEYLLCFLN